MNHGHVTGTRTEKQGASDWYKAIEAENLAKVDAEQELEAYAMAQAREEAAMFRTHLATERAALGQAQLDAEQAALAALTAAAKDALPGQEARIDNGAALVAAHAVWPLTSGSFLVGSQTEDMAAYLVSRPYGGHGWRCECKNFQFLSGLCKHIAASMIAVRMGSTYEPSYS